MLQLFKLQHRAIMAIDISSSAIKALSLSFKKNKYIVEGYGIEPLPDQAIENHIIKDIEAVTNCLKRLITKNHLINKQIIIAVPDSLVITKVIQANHRFNEREIEELALIEAGKYLPYSFDEIYTDFTVLGQNSKNSTLVDVLLVAARAENINSRVEALKRAGLEPIVVDIMSSAVERAMKLLAQEIPAQGLGKLVAVIDIGTVFTQLFILQDMKIIFTCEEKFGAKQLIEAIALHYNLSQEAALTLKISGRMPENYEKEVLAPFLEKIFLPIKRCVQFFFSSSHQHFIDHLLLGGDRELIIPLAPLLQEKIGTPTTIINFFKHLDGANHLNSETFFLDAPSLLILCGLALRAIR